MKKICYLIAMIAVCACGGKEPVPNGNPNGKPDEPEQPTPVEKKIPLSITTSVTKVTDNIFDEGDAVGLYVVNRQNGNKVALANSGNHLTNVRFALNSGSWSADQTYYWEDSKTHADFYCYYPYQQNVANVSSVMMSVKADQSSLQDFKASEILWGSVEDQQPTESNVGIAVSHSNSQFAIILKPGRGYTYETMMEDLESITITGLKIAATMNLADGKLTETGSATSMKPYYDGTCFKALVIPQTVANSDLVSVSINGRTYTLTQSIEFKANTKHSCTLTVNKIAEGIDIGIGGWDSDENDYGAVLN